MARTLLIGFLIGTMLLGTVPLASDQSNTAMAGPEHVLIHVEAPVAGATVTGTTMITGWAIDPTATGGSGIPDVHVYLDGEAGQGRMVGAAATGLPRPDIASLYGANFLSAGFSLRWDTRQVTNGPHLLYVHARAIGGWTHSTVEVVVTGGLPAPPPTATPIPPTPTAIAVVATVVPPTPTPEPAPPPMPEPTVAPAVAVAAPPASAPAASRPRRARPGADVPPPSPELPVIGTLITDRDAEQVVGLTPLPRGIRWTLIKGLVVDASPLIAVYAGNNQLANAWLELPTEEKDAYVRQMLSNMGEVFVNDDIVSAGVYVHMTTTRRADIPNYVPNRSIDELSGGRYEAGWVDALGIYSVPEGEVLMKSPRMRESAPRLTR